MNIFVSGSRNCTCQESHAKDMLTLTCWRTKYGETVQKIFTSWFSTYCIYIWFFLFDASTKKLFESFHYHVLLCFCLAAVVVQENTANNCQYLWLFFIVLVVKSKLPLRSGSSLEAVEAHPLWLFFIFFVVKSKLPLRSRSSLEAVEAHP